MAKPRGKGDLIRAALRRDNRGPVPYGEMHFDQGFVTRYYGRPARTFHYRDEIRLSLQVGRGLIKPFWYGSIFATPQGGKVETASQVETMVVRGGLAMAGVTADEAAQMRRAIAECREAGLLAMAQLGGTLSYAWRTTGFETLMTAFYTDRPFVERVLERTVARQRRCAEALADCGFEAVMFSDDVSGNMGLLVSPALFRELIIPGYRRILEPLVQAGVGIVFHSDGIVLPVLDDIIGCGVAAYQSIEYGLNDLRTVVARYGDRLSLWGNINCDVVHAGPLETLPCLVRECLDAAAGFPGYVIGTDNSIFEEIPIEHFLAYHRALAEAGVAVEPLPPRQAGTPL
jgi:uroporphyrinogen-III decarboxylase